MRRFESLKDPELLSDVQKIFPRGAAFRYLVGALVRQVVIVLNDRFYDLGSPIRISVDPVSDRNEKDGTPRLPVTLIVKDGEFRRTIGIVTQETSVMVAGRLIVTSRDWAVTRVAGAIIAAVENVLEPTNEKGESA